MMNFDKFHQILKSKLFLIALIMLLNILSAFNQRAVAQVATQYIFSTSNIGRYVPITGGHVVGGASDDDNAYLDSIGFNFNYNGTYFTALSVDANGYIVLGYGSLPGYFSGAPLSMVPNCISAFANDLQGLGLSTSEMRIQTIGTAPYRTCVIQWTDWSLYNSPSPPTSESYNFQIRLNENNGHEIIQIVYGHFASGATSSAPIGTISGTLGVQAGINGSTLTDFNSRTSTSSWSSTSAGVANFDAMSAYSGNLPDSGRAYTWNGLCSLILNDSITSGSQSICQFTAPAPMFGSTPTGGTGFSYLWQSSITGATSGFSAATGTNNTKDYFPSFVSSTTWFRRVLSSGTCTDTTVARRITVTNTNTWTGSLSNAWATVSNWSCLRLPVNTDSVVIDPAAFSMPVIIDGGRATNSLTILPSASLTLNSSASDLTVNGIFTLSGTLSQTNGLITFARPAAQTIPAATYSSVTLNDNAGTALAGNITINGTLTLSAGNVTLNNNSITLGGTTSSVSGASASKYIVTNALGSLNIQNIGTGARTGAVAFPVGSTSSYTPVTLTNTGTSDEFRVRVYNGVNNVYSGNSPGGNSLTANAVNRTWVINEVVAGGSNATATLQWNATDELVGFNRAASYASRYGTSWNPGTATAASGTNPYTQTISGFTSMSVFGVGSGGALPVQLLSFTANKNNNSSTVELRWSTANELNNNYFTIERSTDGNAFYQLNEVKGKGTSNNVEEYNLTDDVSTLMQQHYSTVYYRLKQVDMDGKVNDGGIVTVNISKNISGIAMNAEPNPFTTALRVSIATNYEETVKLTITDMTGRTVAQQTAAVKAGDNKVELANLNDLKDGMYFIIVTSSHGIISQKVIRNNH